MARLTKQDWLRVGLEEMSESGFEGIKIERLCKRLEISIGSFYHHFVNIEEYSERLIEAWEAEMNSHLSLALDGDSSPEHRLKMFHDSALEHYPRMEAVARTWALQSEYMSKILDKMDKKRLRQLQNQFLEMGYKAEEAKQLAEVEYAIYLGVVALSGQRKPQARKLYSAMSALVRGRRDQVSKALASV